MKYNHTQGRVEDCPPNAGQDVHASWPISGRHTHEFAVDIGSRIGKKL
jgi:hypothetical protein